MRTSLGIAVLCAVTSSTACGRDEQEVNPVVIEHAGGAASHPHAAIERNACRPCGAAGLAARERDLGANLTNTIFRSLPAEATAGPMVFRGDATDYTAAEHGKEFSEAGTDCKQNLQPEGPCPEPACR